MLERDDLKAALSARRELGPDYDDEIVDKLLAKIEKRIEQPPRRGPEHLGPITPLTLGSIGLGIPITAVALSNAPGIGGEIVAGIAWAAIAVANVAIARWR